MRLFVLIYSVLTICIVKTVSREITKRDTRFLGQSSQGRSDPHPQFGESFLTCGQRRVNPNKSYNSVFPGEWPWSVSVNKDGLYICAGTLIDDHTVLTAASCLFDPHVKTPYPPQLLSVVLGAPDKSKTHVAQLLDVASVKPFQYYVYPSGNHDIAIVYLAGQAKLNDYVQPACLFLQDLNILTENYPINGFTVGYGENLGDQKAGLLKASSLPIVPYAECLTSNPFVSQEMICAGLKNGPSVCNADDGSGLYINLYDKWYLVGISTIPRVINDGNSVCHTDGYRTFLNIAFYSSWIMNPQYIDNFNAYANNFKNQIVQNTVQFQKQFFDQFYQNWQNQANFFNQFAQPNMGFNNFNIFGNLPSNNFNPVVPQQIPSNNFNQGTVPQGAAIRPPSPPLRPVVPPISNVPPPKVEPQRPFVSPAVIQQKPVISPQRPFISPAATPQRPIIPPSQPQRPIVAPAPQKPIVRPIQPPVAQSIDDIIDKYQNPLISGTATRISDEKCQDYIKKGFASIDGKRTYMKLYKGVEPISDGRFVSENTLLFPAHEVYNTNPTHVEKSRGKTSVRFDVAEVIVHPNFIPGKLYNDFALIRLTQNANFDSTTKISCLYTKDSIPEDQLVADGDPIKIIPLDQCKAKLPQSVLKNEYSAGLTGSQFCVNECQTRKLALKNPKSDHSNLAGFLSYCTDDQVGTGIYTKITPYLNWIEQNVWFNKPSAPRPTVAPIIVAPIRKRISERKCDEYNSKGFASIDGKQTYIRLYQNNDLVSDGRFISENFIILPAHEVANSKPTHVEKTKGKTTTRYNIREVILHPDYIPGRLYNDLALVRLSEPALFNSGTKVFCLNTRKDISEDQLVGDGDPLKIVPKVICESKIDQKVLQQELPVGISQYQMCINECQTRKLAIKDPDSQHSDLIGFLSYCTAEKSGTGIYIKLEPYLDWIEKIVWGASGPKIQSEITPQISSTSAQRISEKKCQEYIEKDFVSVDGKRTYMRVNDASGQLSDGRFISENFLILPAHEVYKTNPTHVEKSRGKVSTRYDIDSIIIHPDYVPGKLYNDLALVKLKTNAEFNTGTRVFCLPTNDQVPESQVIGDGDPIKVLQKQQCEANIGQTILSKELTNGISNNQICLDMCQTRKLGIKNPDLQSANLAGFISYCTAEQTGTGVYTKLYPYLSWIEQNVWPGQ